MWIEYKNGIYNTENWKTIKLFGPKEYRIDNRMWVVVLNDDTILYETGGETLAKTVYTKFKSTLCVKNKINIEK